MQDVLQILGEGSLQELKEVVAQLEAAEKLIIDINNAGAKFEFGTRSVKTFNEMAAAAKEVEANTNAMRQAAASYEKQATSIYNKLKSLSEEQQKAVISELKIQEEVKQSLQGRLALEASIKKATTASADSIKGMSQQLAALRKEYDLLTKAEREDLKVGGERLKQIQELDAEIKQLEATTGRHQRNVGNYATGWNALGNSITQLTREMPAFANSMQTGFMAISNNIPALKDAIDALIAKNKALKAEGKPTESVFKQVGASLFSLNTLFSVGITLLVVYGGKIGEMLIKLFQGKKTLDEYAIKLDQINKAYDSPEVKNAISNVEELRINIGLAKNGLIDKDKVLRQYNETIGKTTGEVSNLDAAEQALAKNADAYVKMTLYKAAANIALEEAAKQAIEAEKQRLKDEKEFRNYLVDPFKSAASSATQIDPNDPNAEFMRQQAKAARQRRDRERKAEAIKEAQDAADLQQKIGADFLKRAAQTAAKYKFDFFGGSQDDKQKMVDEYKKQLEAWNKAVAQFNEDVVHFKFSFQKPDESEIKADIQAVQNYLDRPEVELTKTIEIKFGKISQNVADAQAKANENMLGIELAFQNQLFKTYEDYENAKSEEAYRASKERLQIQIDGLKELLNHLPENSKQRVDAMRKVTELELEITAAANKKRADDDKKTNDKIMQERLDAIAKFDDWSRRALDVASSIAQTMSNGYQNRINDLESLNSAIDKNLQKEIAAIQAKGLTQQQQEEQIAIAKARAASQEEKNNKKIAEYRMRQAQLDKAIAIAGIIQNTAVAVMQFWSKGNIPLAVAAGIAGAAQVAAVASRPLPKYEKGTESSEGGPAIVSEKGPELVIEPDGSQWITPEKQAIVMLKKHSKVIPNHKLMEMHKSEALNMALIPVNEGAQFDDRKIVEALVANQMGIKAVHRELEKANAMAQRQSRYPNYNFRSGYHDSMYR